MKLVPPELDASPEEWRSFAVKVHACQEQWGQKIILAIAGAVVAGVISFGGFVWAEAVWHGQTTQRLDDLAGQVGSIQIARADSRKERNEEIKDIGDRLNSLEVQINSSLRDARK